MFRVRHLMLCVAAAALASLPGSLLLRFTGTDPTVVYVIGASFVLLYPVSLFFVVRVAERRGALRAWLEKASLNTYSLIGGLALQAWIVYRWRRMGWDAAVVFIASCILIRGWYLVMQLIAPVRCARCGRRAAIPPNPQISNIVVTSKDRVCTNCGLQSVTEVGRNGA